MSDRLAELWQRRNMALAQMRRYSSGSKAKTLTYLDTVLMAAWERELDRLDSEIEKLRGER